MKFSSLVASAALMAISTADAALSMCAGSGGGVEIVGDNSSPAMSITGLNLSYERKYLFTGGERSATADGFSVVCRPPSDFPSDKACPSVTMSLSATNGAIAAVFTVEGVGESDGFRPRLSMLARRFAPGMAMSGTAPKCGFWVRDPDGGQPWEENAGTVVSYTNAAGGIKCVYRPGEAGNPAWHDPWNQHIALIEDGPGRYVSRMTIYDAASIPDDRVVQLAAAGRDIGVAVSTEMPYNLFIGAKTLAFKAEVMNPASLRRTFDVSWCVRGFNGETFSSGRGSLEAEPFRSASTTVEFKPGEPRGIYFVEVVASDPTGAPGAFARTNIALLPPYSFRDGPDRSPFGISAYWPLPDEESVQKLMDRMGVMWVRSGDTTLQHPPRRANRHSSADVRKLRGEEREAWIEKQLEECRAKKNEYWEFANELNMSTAGIALKSHGIGKALMAPDYVEFVKEIERIRSEKGYDDVKLLSLGLAGYDGVFVDRMKELGAWECIKGFCLHPGRGNFTVDYPFVAPERKKNGRIDTEDVSKAERLANSSFWNFYGAVRGLKEHVARFGVEMPIWLTEVYAPTYPNSWWEDTLRCSAENVVLMYALIKAEGVKCGFYYQLFDGVWYDQLGIKISDREYHFGLMNRDMSPKPAFMAYCAIAETLDGAEFAGWMKPPGEKTHGLVFRSPRGAFAVLWDRTDGYVLTKRPPNGVRFRSPEPWDDQWRSRVRVRLPVGKTASFANAIGQKRPLACLRGYAEVEVGGAPVVVRGIDVGRIQFAGE